MKIMVCADVATYKIADQVDAEYCKPLLRDMKPILEEADFRIANRECVLCDEGIGGPIVKSGPALRGEVKNAAFLQAAGIDCAAIANNPPPRRWQGSPLRRWPQPQRQCRCRPRRRRS